MQYVDPTAVRRPLFPSAATVKKRRPHKAGSTLDADYSLEDELLPPVSVSRLDASYRHPTSLHVGAAGTPQSGEANEDAGEGPSWRDLSYTHGLALSKAVVVRSPGTAPQQTNVSRRGTRPRSNATPSPGACGRAARTPRSGAGSEDAGEGQSWRDLSYSRNLVVSKAVVERKRDRQGHTERDRERTPQQKPEPGLRGRRAEMCQSAREDGGDADTTDEAAAGPSSLAPWQVHGPEEDHLQSSWIELEEKTSELKLQQEALEAERHAVKARLAAATEAEERAQQALAQVEEDRLVLLQLRETATGWRTEEAEVGGVGPDEGDPGAINTCTPEHADHVAEAQTEVVRLTSPFSLATHSLIQI